MSKIIFPKYVTKVIAQLQEAGFEAFAVGGCIRELLRDQKPKDWDITTNALPEQIQEVFPKNFYTNTFGTVTALIDSQQVEITTYRSEAKYSNKRHPDEVKFGVILEEDLKRRDFTMNAIAADGTKIIDLFDGQADLKAGVIRAVGTAHDRFNEDALRMIRAIRFAAQLRMQIEPATWAAIVKNRALIQHLSQERIRDELMKMLNTDDPLRAIWLLFESGLLALILPELVAGVGVAQNKHHIYTVFFHNLLSMAFCPSSDPLVKLACLLHDVGKVRTKEGTGKDATFHRHEMVGADMTRDIMRRLKFSTDEIKRVTHLVRQHMFYYNTGEITDAGVRRIVRRIGNENIEDIMAVRVGDRMGSGVQKEKPYKLVELEKRIIEVQKDPITTSMMAIDGTDVMKQLALKPGRMIGVVLNTLLEEVLDDPKKNTVEYLTKRVGELGPQALAGTLEEPAIMKEDQKEREKRVK
ncbi:MAG: hypothetical protein A3F54_04495 [Candidatus Kerfeldbacteria bacterium RIFCSPHIGHO2_12_FULL_48_17]|uniref:HD domain-containing protein n=1 Tax=Candidatus Kerfeldbacteria bacterium RIFCSPHIGHO2_12_FULL_48_17 TaxID=1798542 RepID=A0A1G2B337_9BACT|nr:MAG: hypothetical protein A3F54_04495 [Candidatus Kerfeldbacteria bacterium RIFCSPHIGHO2_12_FULL_48_17]